MNKYFNVDNSSQCNQRENPKESVGFWTEDAPSIQITSTRQSEWKDGIHANEAPPP